MSAPSARLVSPRAAAARCSRADRNGWIDCLRALAAVGVAIFHLNLVVPAPAGSAFASAWQACWNFGYLGVSVFFVLSGYCIARTWEKSPNLLVFARRRARRILPPYWASLALVAALAVGFKLTRGVNDVATLPATPASIFATLMLVSEPATSVKNINWVYWSLVTEAAFYGVCSLLLLAPSSRPTRPWRLAFVHAALCAIALWPSVPRTGAFFLIPFWPLFGLGAGLALRATHPTPGAFMLAVSSLHFASEFASRGIGDGALLTAILTALLLTVLLPRRLPAGFQPLARFGAMSYSLYLIHVPLGLYFILRLMPAGSGSLAPFLAAQVLWLALVSAATGVFWLLFERPFLSTKIA